MQSPIRSPADRTRPHIPAPLLHRTYIARVDRPLVQLLMQRLLSSGARTADGDEADWYLVPYLIRTRTHAQSHLASTIHYIRKHWPWWDKHHGGHRHLLVAPGEGGRLCGPVLLVQGVVHQ